MRRDQGVALLLVLFISLLMAATAAAAIAFGNSIAKANREREWSTRALYGAEAALARSLHDLSQGGTGEIAPVAFGGLTISASISGGGGTMVISAAAENTEQPGAYASLQGYATPVIIQIPKVAAVYVSPTTVLDFNGQALSLDGREEFALAVADADGDNYDTLLDQIDLEHWDNIQGQEAAPSIGEVPPIDLDDLYSGLVGAADTDITNLGTEGVPRVTYHDGDLHLSGNRSGAGVLVVDGDLDLTGRFSFVGLVFVRGSITLAGGGDQLFVIGSLVATENFTVSGTADVFYDAELLAETEILVNSLTHHYELAAYVRT